MFNRLFRIGLAILVPRNSLLEGDFSEGVTLLEDCYHVQLLALVLNRLLEGLMILRREFASEVVAVGYVLVRPLDVLLQNEHRASHDYEELSAEIVLKELI